MAVHFIRSAMATVLLSQRRTSPSSETKPGKAPKEVEYVGESHASLLIQYVNARERATASSSMHLQASPPQLGSVGSMRRVRLLESMEHDGCMQSLSGLDEQQQQLLFFRPSPESRRSIRLPMNALLRHKQLTVRTDLQDNHLYIFNRAVLEILHAKPNLANIKQVLPFAFSVACSPPCCRTLCKVLRIIGKRDGRVPKKK